MGRSRYALVPKLMSDPIVAPASLHQAALRLHPDDNVVVLKRTVKAG